MNLLPQTTRINLLALAVIALSHTMSSAAEPNIESIAFVPQLTLQSDRSTTVTIQSTSDVSQTNWLALTNLVVTQSPFRFVDEDASSIPQRFYRVFSTPTPNGMSLIPSGSFQMGDSLDGETDARTHTVFVTAFFIDVNLVTFALWQQVYGWAKTNGYTFTDPGSGKARAHPVQTVNWFDAVKWCNARSEFEGLSPCYFTSAAQTNVYRKGEINLDNSFVNWNANGYRLPTEAEWEKAARGGVTGHRFPWSDTDTINLSRANYYANPGSVAYDVSVRAGSEPAFNDGIEPYTSPVGYYAPNGYGLYDITGNVAHWVWDVYGAYSSLPQTDPRGPASGSDRVTRGGTWCCGPDRSADQCRNAKRDHGPADALGYGLGFRCIRTFAR